MDFQWLSITFCREIPEKHDITCWQHETISKVSRLEVFVEGGICLSTWHCKSNPKLSVTSTNHSTKWDLNIKPPKDQPCNSPKQRRGSPRGSRFRLWEVEVETLGAMTNCTTRFGDLHDLWWQGCNTQSMDRGMVYQPTFKGVDFH